MKGITDGLVRKGVIVLAPFLLLMTPVLCFAQSSQLEGKWDAVWRIQDVSMSKAQNNSMRGQMNFKSNGRVEVVAYGYPGCLFSHDTIKNELQWKAYHDSLIFYSPQDNFSLTYIVQQGPSGEVLLRLMEDIVITLKP
jgi:hypothetical protein